VFTATDGYQLLDEFQLVNGDWENMSYSKATLALDAGNEDASQALWGTSRCQSSYGWR
jgi:hypothetical protein